MRWPREFLLEQSVLLVDQLRKHENWNKQTQKRLRNTEGIAAVGGNEADCAQISADTEVDRISIECSAQVILKIRTALLLISADLKQKPKGNHYYGLCLGDGCGSPICTKRLGAIPWANLCLECQSQREEDNQQNRGFDNKRGKIVHSRSVAAGSTHNYRL